MKSDGLSLIRPVCLQANKAKSKYVSKDKETMRQREDEAKQILNTYKRRTEAMLEMSNTGRMCVAP